MQTCLKLTMGDNKANNLTIACSTKPLILASLRFSAVHKQRSFGRQEVIPNVGYKINALESIPIDSPFGPNASKFTRLSNGLNYGLTIALAYHI